MSVATVGMRYQIVIPAKERKKIGLKPNQKVNVMVKDGIIIVEPIGAQPVRGILRELRNDIDAVDYIGGIRREWDERA
ncbi:AbrB/MazE/SpoVT family DNA-binding domain-containing protein [bacterium]|nr:AbrB/MazE/SpoVT family DNA-binding domain-containing protein [bacterium]